MTKNELKMPLSKLDDLFTTQEERNEASLEKVCNLSLKEICDFPDHPFKVIINEEMQEMVNSVKERGVLVPALVRPLPNGKYQMIAGHRRKMASELANKQTMPCIIRDLTDDEAIIIMVDSNMQREKILPSERAFAYKMKIEAMNRQGKRTDLTFSQLGKKLNAYEELAQEVGESRNQIHRFIRLTELIKPLLDMVDNETIAFSPAVELSYLTKEEQNWLLDSIECNIATPSLSQAQEMKKLSQSGKLDIDGIEDILSREKPNQVEKLKLDYKSLTPKMPKGMTREKYAEHIFKALDYYNKFLEKQRNMQVR